MIALREASTRHCEVFCDPKQLQLVLDAYNSARDEIASLKAELSHERYENAKLRNQAQ